MLPLSGAQFGPSDAMQQHGFARNVDWAISTTSADPQPDDREPEASAVHAVCCCCSAHAVCSAVCCRALPPAACGHVPAMLS